MGTIAIIDDDLYIRDLLAENCQLMGHRTITAGSLRETGTVLSKEPLDLVFLDVRLPDGSGLDLLSKFKNLPNAPEDFSASSRRRPTVP
jgi:two-component system NtrC family response regulator